MVTRERVPVSHLFNKYETYKLVSYLQKLKEAKSLSDLSEILGYKPSAVSFLIIKMPENERYIEFEIPKKKGGTRKISAPNPQLKLLQRRLANVLTACNNEIEYAFNRKALSHGFREDLSIITNAKNHRNRRYVLNIDLEDFFPSFNFGRIQGYFIKNQHFQLHEKVAQTIAKIACFKTVLPQGSPCSPIITELITHILDVRLAQLSRKHKVTYSRYADDITFSTNKKEFPENIAYLEDEQSRNWALGSSLTNLIENCDFRINNSKIRMQYRGSRQVVTGLTVNKKVNIQKKYYKNARAMCYSLFNKGEYFFKTTMQDDKEVPLMTNNIAPLEGILSFIHHIKDTNDLREDKEKKNEPSSFRELYKSFLIYKHFIQLNRPIVICEGITDKIYVNSAIKMLPQFHPKLGAIADKQYKANISFFNYGNLSNKIMQLGGGSGDLKKFLIYYEEILKRYDHKPMEHPIIMLIDNDDGANNIFSVLNKKFNININHLSSNNFYHITENLYLIKTPELGGSGKSYIEKLFDQNILDTKVDNKSFNENNTGSTTNEYGKVVFAEQVIKPNANNINFNRFSPLLERIESVIDSYTSQ